MQVTLDGFVAGPSGQLDWMTRDMDPEIIALINELTDTSSTMLLGRGMTPGFVTYWEAILAKPDDPQYTFARKMVDMEKVVFSRTLHQMEGQNVRVHHGDAAAEVEAIKRQPGKDVVVYGGARFVASLIDSNLIDEFNFFYNPVAISDGLRIFSNTTKLNHVGSMAYPSGIVVSTYRPR
jgi:dihydrofolate reductase